MTEAAPPAVARSFLTVQVGDEFFALPASDVAEVIRPPAVTRVPLGPSSLLGVANLRGAVMPVVSLRGLLGGSGTPSPNARVVVIDRGTPIGLVIDKVASLGAERLEPMDDAGDGSAPARAIDLEALLAKGFSNFSRRLQHKPATAMPTSQDRAIADFDEAAFVCFSIAGQDFALPLASVHEVVALPEDIAIVPQTDPVMRGVITLRGQLLPLIALRGLLGLHTGTSEDLRPRVVVVRIGKGLAGLVIDGMKEILRIPAGQLDPVPAILTRGDAEAKIQGICRLDGGQRLVSVLSTDHLFRDQTLIEQIAQHMETDREMDTTDAVSGDEEQFIVFRLGGEEYGLPISSVDEVVRVPDTLTRLPKAPAFIEGVMNLRGRVVPVIDQRQRFKLDGRGDRRKERVVVVRIDHTQAGFIVDAVSDVLRIPHDQLRPTPDLASDGSQVIDRIANIEVDGRMILLLNPRELLDKAEKDLLAAMDVVVPDRSAP